MNENDFSAAMREAEAERGLGDGSEHLVAGLGDAVQAVEPVDIDADQRLEQPRDDNGQFAADTAADGEQTDGDQPEERLYAGRYRSVDELERAIEEKEAFIARQGTDVGELRRQIDEQQRLLAQVAQLQQQQAMQPAGDVEAAIYDNPAQASNYAYQALQRGDLQAYDRIVAVWEDVDKPTARAYDRQVQQWLLQQQMQPQYAAANQVVARQADQEAQQAVASRHPDFQQVVQSITPERLQQIASDPGFPITQEMLLATDAVTKTKVYEAIYRWEKAERVDTLAKANADATARTTEEARTEKQQAQVASASRAAAPAPEMTEEDRLAELAASSHRVSWRR